MTKSRRLFEPTNKARPATCVVTGWGDSMERLVRWCSVCLLGVLVFTPWAAAERVLLVPGVARVTGNNNTAWRSDAVFHNPTAAAQTVEVELLPRGSAAVAAQASLPLAPGETRSVENLYEFLHAADGAGMLRLTGDVVSWVRTYNRGGAGSFGQDLAAVAPGEGWNAGEVLVFPFARPADTTREFRSNLLLVNLDTAAITVTMRAGAIEKTKTVDPGTYAQIDNVGTFLGAPVGFGAVRLWATGRWFGVMSTVDPFTGDPTTVRGLPPAAGRERLYAGVAKVTGTNQTVWRSEATFHNPGDAPAQVKLELIPRGAGNVAASTTLTLAVGETRRLADLYQTLNVASGAGALRVSGPVLAWVRTFNQGTQGSFGQDLPPLDPALAAGAGIPVALPFRSAANTLTDFRSNLVVQNFEARDITLSLRVGNTERTQRVTARSYAQIDNLGSFLGVPPGAHTAWVQADGSWAGTVSTIDPFTGDPTTLRGDRDFAPPSSYDLIEAALANQTVNAEQALLYKVYVDFGDPRLPAALRGDDRNLGEGEGAAEAAARFPTLTAATQELVGPFLVQPFYAGSWWDLRRGGSGLGAQAVSCRPWATGCSLLTGDWNFVDGIHVRVWYLKAHAATDALVAADLIAAADGPIWTALNAVMGRVPKPDAGEGGSDRYDIVLSDSLPAAKPGNTIPTELFSCKNTPAFTTISRGVTDPDKRRSLVAHEMFHGVQYGTPSQSCIESMRWLMESTASWFEDHVYQFVDREHVYAASYLKSPNLSIDSDNGDNTSLRNYGGYLFFQYLTRFRGTAPTVVGQIWAATASANQLKAMETALRGAGADLDESWPEFAAYAWNLEAPYDKFDKQDRMTKTPTVAPPRAVSLGIPSSFYEVKNKSDLRLPHLSIRYYPFEFPDNTASAIVIYNGISRALDLVTVDDYGDVFSSKPLSGGATAKGAHLTLLVKINGQWKKEELTGVPGAMYCRDTKAERLEELMVIVSNSSVDEPTEVYPHGEYSPLVFASRTGCGAWEGDANLAYRWGDAVVERIQVSTFRFEPMIDGFFDDHTALFRAYTPVAGEFAWSATGSNGSCSYSGGFNGSVAGGLSVFHQLPWVAGGVGYRGIVADMFWPWLQVQMVMRETCPPPTGSTMLPWGAGAMVLAALPESTYARVSPDGRSMTIDASRMPGSSGVSGTWNFRAIREP